MIINLVQKAQIALLVVKEVIISIKYSDFTDVFSKKLPVELFECSDIIKDSINSEYSKQLPYSLIHTLRLVEFKTLKSYIKTNLANGFIQPSKSPAKTLILFF